jgi:predicted transcriptional regulator
MSRVDTVHLGIEKVLSSPKKRDIFLRLLSCERRVSEMAKELSLSKSSVSHHVNALQNIGVVEKGSKIKLTNIGKILAHQLRVLELSCKFLSRDMEFWNGHDLDSIPGDMLLRIFELRNCEIVKSDEGELLKYLQSFCSTLSNASFVRIISSVSFPECVSALSKISRNTEVSLLVSDKVFKAISRDYSSLLSRMLENGVEIYVVKNLRLLCLVTDIAVCLGLYLKGGEFDVKCGLISREKSAIKWGLDLFEMLKSKSTPVFG